MLDQLIERGIEFAFDRAELSEASKPVLDVAVERLRGQEALSKVAILLTDGVNNAGQIAPLQAAELAAQHDGVAAAASWLYYEEEAQAEIESDASSP